jgi:hypothetical protein
LDKPRRETGTSATISKRWRRVAGAEPERWEHPEFGAIEARGPELWAILPTCGHGYGALDLGEAQLQVQEQAGLCYSCSRAAKSVG